MIQHLRDSFKNQLVDLFDSEFIITKADPKGRITYANDLFCKISGYSREELLGKPHNIVRHPDMPKSLFKDLWTTIKEHKKPWKGLVKNKTKEGGFYWVIATIFPIFDPNNSEEILEYISIRKEITSIMVGYERDQVFSKLYEVLAFYYDSNDLKAILDFALKKILELPWLEVQKKGGIMLWNSDKQELEMFVHTGVGQSLLEMCNRVPTGRCLCGRAALRQEIIFKSCVDNEHENRPAGMTPHGHYNVPLMFNEELLGVLFLYVEHEHIKKDIEVQFLKLLGNLLGSIIYKFKQQEKLEKLSMEVYLILQHMRMYSSKSTYSYAKEFIESLTQNPTEANHKKIITRKYLYLIFLDVVNFTGLSENESPEIIVEIIDSLFKEIVGEIYKNNGDVDKFIGDAIFAYFEDPKQCFKTGVKILEILDSKERNPHQLSARIGIHCGEVVQTNLGGEFRKDFTLIGDTVNTTQRLEKASKPNSILASETFLNTIDRNLFENVQVSKRHILQAKHKSSPIPVYFITKAKVKT